MKLPNLLSRFHRPHGSEPETGNAAPARGPRPTLPGGGPGGLTARRSSGPPAPQLPPAPIPKLPEHVLTRAFRSLPAGDLVRTLPAIQSTGRDFRKIVDKDVYLKGMARAGKLANESAAILEPSYGTVVALHIPLFPILLPKHRTHLVKNCALNANFYDSNTWIERWTQGTRLAARGLAHLDKELQAKVVDTTIKYTEGAGFVAVLRELVTKLAHLDVEQRGRLVDKAIGLPEAEHRSNAIGAFSAGLADLERKKQQDLLHAAMNISDESWRYQAIAGLCKGLKYLHADERKVLFEKATEHPPRHPQEQAFENLWESLAALSQDQRAALVTGAFKLLDQPESSLRSRAIHGLAAGLEHLEPCQIDRLVTESTERLDLGDTETAVTALAKNLRPLTEAQQDKLLDAVKRLQLDKRWYLGSVIAVLAEGLASLDTSARKDQLGNRLVGMALSLSDSSKAHALAALGPRLGDLRKSRHQELVDAAIGLFKNLGDLDESEARTLSAGLGAGWKHLHRDLRSALIDTICDPQTLAAGVYCQEVASAASAIAGLGAALPHLDEAEFETLFAAADSLKDVDDDRYRPLKVGQVALLGFAAEAAKTASREPEAV
jgi:hypothetical protein